MIKTIVLLVMLAVCVSATGCKREPRGAIQIKVPNEPPKQPQGAKALEVKPGAVPFGTNEVIQYIQTHPLPKTIGDPSQLQLESLDFISAREASVRLQGASTGLPANQRVAFAIVRGTLYFTGPPPSKPVKFNRGYLLFDAETGNLLMTGTLSLTNQPAGATNRPPG